jgi:uncharacterized protein (TIRG00374 family)
VKRVSLFAGAFVGIACVAVGIARLDWAETWSVFKRVDHLYLFIAILLLLICFSAFAERWRHLLDTTHAVPRRRFFGYLMIGYMMNAVVPMRPGDVIRATLLRQQHHIPIATALTSVLLERLFDVLTLVLLGLLLSFLVDLPGAVRVGLRTFSAVALIGTTVLLGLSAERISGERLARVTLFWAPPRVVAFLAARADQFVQALRVLRQRRRLPWILLADLVGWCACGLSMFAFTQALHIDVPWTAGFLILVATSLGAAIPGTPGSVGVFHVLAVMALSVWSVDIETAVAFALVAHTSAVALHIGLGALSASLLKLHVFGAGRGVVPENEADESVQGSKILTARRVRPTA